MKYSITNFHILGLEISDILPSWTPCKILLAKDPVIFLLRHPLIFFNLDTLEYSPSSTPCNILLPRHPVIFSYLDTL